MVVSERYPPKAHHASELEGISENDDVEQRRALIENFLRKINRDS